MAPRSERGRWYRELPAVPDDPKRIKVTHLKFEVYYTKGGSNYFSGNTDRRGYYVCVTPVDRSGPCELMILGDRRGGKMLVEEAARVNAKRLHAIIEDVDGRIDAAVPWYVRGDMVTALRVLCGNAPVAPTVTTDAQVPA